MNAPEPCKVQKNLTNAGKGRKPGVPNRTTRRVRDAIAQVLTLSAPEIARWLQQVGETDPRAGLQYAVALAKLVTPRTSTLQETAEHNPPTSRERAREEFTALLRAVPPPPSAVPIEGFTQQYARAPEPPPAVVSRMPSAEPHPRAVDSAPATSGYSTPGQYVPFFHNRD